MDIKYVRFLTSVKLILYIFLFLQGFSCFSMPKNKIVMTAKSWNLTSELTRYYQYQLTEGKDPDQISEVTLTPSYETKKFKLISILNYSKSDLNSDQADWDDPIINLSTIPKNIFPAIKGRSFLTSTVGLSKLSREENKQYGALGMGYGIIMDSDFLKIPAFSFSSSLSLLKAFQESEETTKAESNVNLYSVSNNIFAYNWRQITATIQFKFINKFKYNEDFANEYITAQEISYPFAKELTTVMGHANAAKTMDEETGDFNIRVLNNETSYFYFKIQINI